MVFAYPGVRRARAVIVGDGKGWVVAGQEVVLQGVGRLAALRVQVSAPPAAAGGLPGGKGGKRDGGGRGELQVAGWGV